MAAFCRFFRPLASGFRMLCHIENTDILGFGIKRTEIFFWPGKFFTEKSRPCQIWLPNRENDRNENYEKPQRFWPALGLGFLAAVFTVLSLQKLEAGKDEASDFATPHTNNVEQIKSDKGRYVKKTTPESLEKQVNKLKRMNLLRKAKRKLEFVENTNDMSATKKRNSRSKEVSAIV